jgi:uncharacterized protein (DUF2336 family)
MAGSDRAAYAERVAAVPTLPKQLAKKLASDSEIKVAGPVLKLSPVLPADELAGIASTHSQLHLWPAAAKPATAVSRRAAQKLSGRGGR